MRDALGIASEQVEYKQMDIYDLSEESVEGRYDVVLLLRVLYHLSDPLLALQKVREVCRGYLVADIKMAKHDSPVFDVRIENHSDPRNAVGSGLALRPSRSAVDLMLSQSGFQDIASIPPRPPLPPTFLDGTRALFTARVAER